MPVHAPVVVPLVEAEEMVSLPEGNAKDESEVILAK